MTLPASKEEVSQAYADPMRANIQEDPLSVITGLRNGILLSIPLWCLIFGMGYLTWKVI